jgi:hypothetical protein
MGIGMFMARKRKPRGFYYLDHRSVDAAYSIIHAARAVPAAGAARFAGRTGDGLTWGRVSPGLPRFPAKTAPTTISRLV